MRVVQIGNMNPPHSTENELRRALLTNGHTVSSWQENDPDTWTRLLDLRAGDAAFVLWTRTWTLDHAAQLRALLHLEKVGIPTVGYHLDRWWGLQREHLIRTEPFFTGPGLLVTADGGHDAEWAKAGIDHVWFPPAISAEQLGRGTPRAEFTHDVVFTGTHQPGRYHEEWRHRPELIAHLRHRYGSRLGLYPERGKPAVRGRDLADLYAGIAVVVGDSCLVGDASRYFSDRIPESLGRGAYLIHPHVEGVTDGSLYTAGEHLDCWPVGDWPALFALIDHALDDPEHREKVSQAGMEHVSRTATYEIRTRQLTDLLTERGML